MAQQDKPKKPVKRKKVLKDALKDPKNPEDSINAIESKSYEDSKNSLESTKAESAKGESIKRDSNLHTKPSVDSIAPEPIRYDPHTLAQSLHNADNIATLLSSGGDEIVDFDSAEFSDSSEGYTLRFVRGSLKKNEATFIKMLGGEEFIMLPKDAITHILGILQESKEESLKLMLRYAIKDLLPLDLEDAMSVAIYELESQRLENGNFPTINIKNLAKKIRLKHPNLFFGT